MTKTKVINNVPASDVDVVEAGLRADGYVTSRQPQGDKFTVIGVKQVSDVAEAVSSEARRARSMGTAEKSMTKTKVITDVDPADVDTVEAGLKADGYTTSRQRQPEGKFTVIGVKVVTSAAAAVDSTAHAAARSVSKTRRARH